jgi:hypothetical protein
MKLTLITLFSLFSLIVSYAIADGRSNWMEGYLLMNVFILMALAAWYVPDPNPNSPYSVSLFTDDYCRNKVAAIAATASIQGAIATATGVP